MWVIRGRTTLWIRDMIQNDYFTGTHRSSDYGNSLAVPQSPISLSVASVGDKIYRFGFPFCPACNVCHPRRNRHHPARKLHPEYLMEPAQAVNNIS